MRWTLNIPDYYRYTTMFKYIRRHIVMLFRVYCDEFKLVMHDGGIILFFTFLPLVYPIVYSLIYNPEVVRNVSMVVVDHDATPLSREFVRRVDATPEAHVIGYAADLAEARRALNEHKAYGILEIPEGFQRNVGRQEVANGVLYTDMSLMLRYRSFLVAVTNVMQAMGGEITVERINNVNGLITTISTGDPMPVHNISLGNISNGFDSFIMPGVIVLILQQCIVLAAGMAGGARHERMSAIGYNPIDRTPSIAMTMAGQMLCYITVLILPIIFLLHFVPLIFRFPMAGNFMQIYAFLLPFILSSLGLGILFQNVVRERESVFVLWVVTSIIFLFLSGLTWPLYAMPKFWSWVSDLIPATWAVEGYTKMNSNGSSLAQVSNCYINLWLLSALYLGVAYLLRRRRRRLSRV